MTKEPEEELGPHIEDLKRVLGDTVSESELEEKLKEYMKFSDAGVTIFEAKKAIVKKFGGRTNDLAVGENKNLEDVNSRDSSVNLKVKVISVNDKTVNVKGQDKLIYYGLFADTTIAQPFTAWEDFKLTKGDIVNIKSAYAKDFRGEVQINLGRNAIVEKLSPEDPVHDALVNIDIAKIPTKLPGTTYKLHDMTDGSRNVVTTGRIIELEAREITAQGERKTIFTGTLGDETGRIAFTAWHDFELEVDDVVTISGGYVKSWRGVPKLNFDINCKVDKHEDDDMIPDLASLSEAKLVTIEELNDQKGAFGAIVQGIVLEIKKGSGLIYRCPECNRMLQNNACTVHGNQEGVADLRVKAVVDDGTDGLVAIINNDLTTRILGKDLEASKKLTEGSPEGNEIILKELNDKLIAHPIELKGNVMTDNFGLTMICTDLNLIDITQLLAEEARKLIEDMEV